MLPKPVSSLPELLKLERYERRTVLAVNALYVLSITLTIFSCSYLGFWQNEPNFY